MYCLPIVYVIDKYVKEHEKRCWSVDFNQVDTKLIASGSDDARSEIQLLLSDPFKDIEFNL